MKVLNLRAARRARGMRQADLARVCRVSRQTIVSAESGAEISLETWARLAWAFDHLPISAGAIEITPELAESAPVLEAAEA